MAFVGRGASGIQVVNYLGLDVAIQAPTISLSAQVTDVDPAAPGLQVQEKTRIPIRITATDDRQVRNVELLVNGQVVRNDVAFPWDESIVAPVIAGSLLQLSLQARATDLAGNVTVSAPVVIEVVKDTIAPTVDSGNVANGSNHGATFRTIRLTFSESMDAATLKSQNLRVLNALDAAIVPQHIRVSSDARSVELEYDPFAVGTYRLEVDTTAITDQSGNALGTGLTNTTFTIVQSTVSWMNPAGGFWDVAANWSTGVVPGANDDVLIDVPGAVTITYRTGATAINSLHSTKAFTLSGGTLTVADTVQVDGTFLLTGGTLAHATVLRGGAGASMTIPSQAGEVTLDGVRLQSDLTTPTLNTFELRVRNGLTLDGSRITIQSPPLGSPSASILFIGSQTLAGTGEIFFSGTGLGKVLNTGGTLTLGAGITIHGSVSGALGTTSQFSDSILVNQGTISADAPGIVISVNLETGTTFNNEGHLEASNGGALWLDGIRNSGTMSATSGSTVILSGLWTNPGSITMSDSTIHFSGGFHSTELAHFTRNGGTVVLDGRMINSGKTLDLDQNVGSVQLGLNFGSFITGIFGGAVRSSSGQSSILMTGQQQFVLDSVTLGANLTLRSDTTQTFPTLLIVQNGLTLDNAVITLDNVNGASPTTIRFSGPQTLGGNGEVVVTGTAAAVFQGNAANSSSGSLGPLTIGPNITVRGTAFSFSGLQVINQGMIRAEASSRLFFLGRLVNQGTLEANSGAVLYLPIDAQWSNTGVVRLNGGMAWLAGTFTRATLGLLENNGGQVVLLGTLVNTGAILNLNATIGDWSLAGGGTIIGGTVRTQQGAHLVVRPISAGAFLGVLDGTGILDGVTIQGVLAVSEGGVVTARNGLTLANGIVSLTSPGPAASTLAFEGTQTLAGTGEVVFGAGVVSKVTTTGSFTIAPGILVHGAAGTIGSNTQPFINQGRISADTIGQTVAVLGSAVTNQGVLEAKNVGRLTVSNVTNAASGTITADASTLELLGTWHNLGTLTEVTANVILGGQFTLSDLGSFVRTGGTITLAGVLQNNNSTLLIDPTTGLWELAGGRIIGGTVQGNGLAFLIMPSSATGTLDGVTLKDVNLSLGTGARMTALNGLTLLNGFVGLDGTSASIPTTLQFNGTQTVAGTGFIVISGSAGAGNQVLAGVNGGPATTLTIGSGVQLPSFQGGLIGGLRNQDGVVIQGALDGQGGVLSLTNVTSTGLINIFNSSALVATNLVNQGSLQVDNAQLSLNGLWSNSGTITATSSIVNLGGQFTATELGSFQRSGGTVNLTGTFQSNGTPFTLSQATNGSWNLSGGTIAGVELLSDGVAGLAVLPSGSGTLDGVVLGANLSLGDGAHVIVHNGLTLNNSIVTLTNAASVNGTILEFDSTQRLDGIGEVVFTTTGNNRIYSPVGDLTIGIDMVVHGTSGAVTLDQGTLSNEGLISADVSGGEIFVFGASVTNEATGTLEARNGGTLFVDNLDNNLGTIFEESGSRVVINGVEVNGTAVSLASNAASLNVSGLAPTRSAAVAVQIVASVPITSARTFGAAAPAGSNPPGAAPNLSLAYVQQSWVKDFVNGTVVTNDGEVQDELVIQLQEPVLA